MQFLYYRPGHNRTVSHDDVQRWGLGYAFDKQPVSSECMNRTPDGGSGRVFIAFSRNGEVPQMNLDSQTWRKMPGDRDGAPVFVGVWNDAKPTPAELVRADMLTGYPYGLADGHTWVIPRVRRYGDEGHECALPKLWDFDDAGKPIHGDVIAKYRHLWDLTTPIAEDLLATYDLRESPEVALTKTRCIEIAVDLLQVNYRVALPELVLLDALPNDGTVSGLCSCSCDWPELIRRLEPHGNATAEDADAEPVTLEVGV